MSLRLRASKAPCATAATPATKIVAAQRASRPKSACPSTHISPRRKLLFSPHIACLFTLLTQNRRTIYIAFMRHLKSSASLRRRKKIRYATIALLKQNSLTKRLSCASNTWPKLRRCSPSSTPAWQNQGLRRFVLATVVWVQRRLFRHGFAQAKLLVKS